MVLELIIIIIITMKTPLLSLLFEELIFEDLQLNSYNVLFSKIPINRLFSQQPIYVIPPRV